MLNNHIAIGLLVLLLGLPASAEHGSSRNDVRREASGPSPETLKCLNRITQRCYMSKNDQERFLKSVQKCKHVESGSGKTDLEVILQKGSDKVLVVETRGSDYNRSESVSREQQRASDAKSAKTCPATKYNVDKSGINDFKIIGHKIWMVSKDGQLYYATADEQFNEILNSKGRSYRDVKEVDGVTRPTNAAKVLFRDGHSTVITDGELQRKIRRGQVKKLNFVKSSTDHSLFRDE